MKRFYLPASVHARQQPKITWATHSVRGLREENQDTVLTTSPDQTDLIERWGVLIVVCDGIGGEQGGAEASEVAASTAVTSFYASDQTETPLALLEAIRKANDAVCQTAQQTQLQRMGTTIVMAVVMPDRATIAHVGDSRAYLYQCDGTLKQLTQDHVMEGSGKLARALGGIGRSDADCTATPILAGERLLLCTDGLHKTLPVQRIAKLLAEGKSAEGMASNLVAAAYTSASHDNITAAVVACDDLQSSWMRFQQRLAVQFARWRRPKSSNTTRPLLVRAKGVALE